MNDAAASELIIPLAPCTTCSHTHTLHVQPAMGSNRFRFSPFHRSAPHTINKAIFFPTTENWSPEIPNCVRPSFRIETENQRQLKYQLDTEFQCRNRFAQSFEQTNAHMHLHIHIHTHTYMKREIGRRTQKKKNTSSSKHFPVEEVLRMQSQLMNM